MILDAEQCIIEIAPISNSHNIILPSVGKDVYVNILPSSNNVLKINTASSLSIGPDVHLSSTTTR